MSRAGLECFALSHPPSLPPFFLPVIVANINPQTRLMDNEASNRPLHFPPPSFPPFLLRTCHGGQHKPTHQVDRQRGKQQTSMLYLLPSSLPPSLSSFFVHVMVANIKPHTKLIDNEASNKSLPFLPSFLLPSLPPFFLPVIVANIKPHTRLIDNEASNKFLPSLPPSLPHFLPPFRRTCHGGQHKPTHQVDRQRGQEQTSDALHLDFLLPVELPRPNRWWLGLAENGLKGRLCWRLGALGGGMRLAPEGGVLLPPSSFPPSAQPSFF